MEPVHWTTPSLPTVADGEEEASLRAALKEALRRRPIGWGFGNGNAPQARDGRKKGPVTAGNRPRTLHYGLAGRGTCTQAPPAWHYAFLAGGCVAMSYEAKIAQNQTFGKRNPCEVEGNGKVPFPPPCADFLACSISFFVTFFHSSWRQTLTFR